MKNAPAQSALLLLTLATAAALPSFGQGATFEQVPGSLSQISVGADGAVWGLDSNQNIFSYDSSTGQFVQVPGALTQIAVGNAAAVWGLNAQGLIFRWDASNGSWTYIPGFLNQITVGADGDVWGLSANTQGQCATVPTGQLLENGCTFVWHYNQQAQTWNYVDTSPISIYEGVTQLAVGNDGAVYALVNGSPGYLEPFWYNPGTGQFQNLAGELGAQLGQAGGLGSLAVGADGDLWAGGGGHYSPVQPEWDVTSFSGQIAVGSATNVWGISGSEVYQFNVQSGSWVSAGITLTQISAGADGSVWGVDSQNRVFHYTGPTQPVNTLRPIPGSFQQISVAADGTAWAVDANNLIYGFDRQTQSFQIVPGELSQVSVGFAGGVWGVNAGGAIWLRQSPPNTGSDVWTNIPGELNQIAVGANGAVFGINASGQTYKYSEENWFSPAGLPPPSTWVNIPGTLVQLSTGVDGTTWGINAQQQIYQYDSSANDWVNIPGSLVQISVGNAANIWGVNADQHVYRYDATIPGWVQIPRALLTQIAVAFDGAVWGVNAQGGLYQWNSAAQGFDYIGQGVTNVAVGNDNAVFAYNINTGATYWYF